MKLGNDTVLHSAMTATVRENGNVVLLDPERPSWLATDERGASILKQFDGRRTFGQIVGVYAAETGFVWAKAWQHVETITRDAIRRQLLAESRQTATAYEGRAHFLKSTHLNELWIHTNNSCNLTCSHCLVSSGPDGDPGLSTKVITQLIDEARALGTTRFYFTGGEPFVRRDIFELIEKTLDDDEAELAILTNGTLFKGKRLEQLRAFDRERLRLQVSLDGSRPEINDPIRGAGSFTNIVAGIKTVIEEGFQVTVTTAITATNADDVPEVTRLVGSLGGTRHHLLWLHKRGRADGEGPDHTPAIEQVIDVVRRAQAAGREAGVVLDNCEAVKARLNTPAGIKRDLSNACVESLCVYSDGKVYPSAAMANVEELCCGSVLVDSLETIWRGSDVCQQFRQATVEQKEICPRCEFKFLCGGGDVEHSYFYGGSIQAHDPYCELHKAMFRDALGQIADERRALLANGRSGFDAPVAATWMGEGGMHCATGDEEIPEVISSHSECVLSFDLDAPRKKVREFYGAAADEPQEDLCCPVRPPAEDLGHIPQEVLDRFYGCGSPVSEAEIQPGEVTLDLGCGAGIDVFISARRVGSQGRAIGVDMTDQMLKVANENQPIVAKNLGYDVVEFLKGTLEEIPVDDACVDLVTSNCVINLSPDKQLVFSEMWRVLKNHGRINVSDIVADVEAPPHQRRDPRLWGECISGALTEEEFLAYLERAGFYGIQVTTKTFWKELDGFKFYSVTVRGYKYAKQEGCVFVGQHATYLGPFKGIADEEGHYFPRGSEVEVCTDTAAKLSKPPYAGMFLIQDPDQPVAQFSCCDETGCC